MSGSDDNPRTGGNDPATIILILTMVVLTSTIPTAVLLVWLKVVNPEYFRRNVLRGASLPTTEKRPSNNWKHRGPLLRRARAAASKLRGVAVAAGGAVALRSREVFERARGRMSGLFESHRRRRGGNGEFTDDLPIMRQKSWQILAESRTERTFASTLDDEGECKSVENPKKVTKSVHFDLGDVDDRVTFVQKPEPAVVAESKT